MNWRDRISIDPSICHGKACIKGTRIMISVILDNLADGVAMDRILKCYPTLRAEDIDAVLQYKSGMKQELVADSPEDVG